MRHNCKLYLAKIIMVRMITSRSKPMICHSIQSLDLRERHHYAFSHLQTANRRVDISFMIPSLLEEVFDSGHEASSISRTLKPRVPYVLLFFSLVLRGAVCTILHGCPRCFSFDSFACNAPWQPGLTDR